MSLKSPVTKCVCLLVVIFCTFTFFSLGKMAAQRPITINSSVMYRDLLPSSGCNQTLENLNIRQPSRSILYEFILHSNKMSFSQSIHMFQCVGDFDFNSEFSTSAGFKLRSKAVCDMTPREQLRKMTALGEQGALDEKHWYRLVNGMSAGGKKSKCRGDDAA